MSDEAGDDRCGKGDHGEEGWSLQWWHNQSARDLGEPIELEARAELATKQWWRPPQWSWDRLWLLPIDMEHQGFRDGPSGCDGKLKEHRDVLLAMTVQFRLLRCLCHNLWCDCPGYYYLGPFWMEIRRWPLESADDEKLHGHEFPYTFVAEGVPMCVRAGSPVFPLTAQFWVLEQPMSQSMLGHQTRSRHLCLNFKMCNWPLCVPLRDMYMHAAQHYCTETAGDTNITPTPLSVQD